MSENEILYSFTYKGEDNGLEAVSAFLKIPIEKCSAEFGVVLIDPEENRYCIMVDASSVGMDDPQVFSNPRIEGFGWEEE